MTRSELGVPAWRVTIRRRELGVHRPRTGPRRPAPTRHRRRELDRLYTTQGHTPARGRRYPPPAPWCGAGWWTPGSPPRHAPAGSTGNGWTRCCCGSCTKTGGGGPAHRAHLDSTVNTVLRTLDDHGIPLRRGGLPPRHVDRG
ncbi:MAG TPA: hypothetical protein VIJ00_05635 [Nakamurella sp.]